MLYFHKILMILTSPLEVFFNSFIHYPFILQDIQQAHAGQIVAVFGVDCASGTNT